MFDLIETTSDEILDSISEMSEIDLWEIKKQLDEVPPTGPLGEFVKQTLDAVNAELAAYQAYRMVA